MSGCYNCKYANNKRPGHAAEFQQHHAEYWCNVWQKYVPRDYSCEKFEASE